MTLTGTQIRMARAALAWGVRDLAAKAGTTANTISRIEGGGDALAGTLAKIEDALSAAGVEFIQNGVKYSNLNDKTLIAASVQIAADTVGLSVEKLDELTKEHGVAASFAEIVGFEGGSKGYRPTLKGSNTANIIADAYDAAREFQGDPRRAFRGLS